MARAVTSSFVLLSLVTTALAGSQAMARPKLVHHGKARAVAAHASAPTPGVVLAPKATAPHHMRANPEDISVEVARQHVTTGGGLLRRVDVPRNIQYVSRDFIDKQSPTQNIANLLSMMPGVNVTPSDPSGINSSTIEVRGLTANDMGWVLDGAPTVSLGAGPYQAELLDTENMEEIAVAPGSAATDDPVSSSLAGTIYMKMRDPTQKAGAQVDFTYGTFNTYRGFFRGETGEIGHSGIRGFVSVSDAQTRNWYGVGQQSKIHSDAKFLKTFENGSTVAFEQVFNASGSGYYYSPSLSQWRQHSLPSPDATYGGVFDGSFYKLNTATPFYSGTALLPIHIVLPHNLTLDDTPYFWYGFGWSAGANTLQQGSTYRGTSPVDVNLAQGINPGGSFANGTNVLVNNSSYGLTYIGGNTLKLNWHSSGKDFLNDLYVGYWYENYNLADKDPVGMINQLNGTPFDITQKHNQYNLVGGGKWYTNDYYLHHQINAIFVGDNLTALHSRLNVNAGFKLLMVTRTADNYLPGATPHVGTSEVVPLPTLGIRYNLTPKQQVYILGEGDYRQPYMGSTLDAYAPGSGTQVNGASAPKSEYAIKEEAGYRYNGDRIIASVIFYNMNIVNRLLNLNTYQNGFQVTRTLNAGGQTSRGVDMQFATTPLWGCVTPYLTFSYLDAKQNNNIQAVTTAGTTDYLPTTGKEQILSPKYQAGLGLTYDDGNFFGNLNLHYVGKQYSTLMNDESVPGYVTDTLNIGYRRAKLGFLKQPKIQVQLNNINASGQRVGVYGYSNNAQPVRGVFGGSIAGSPPSYYIDPAFSALMTVSVGL